MLSINLAHNAGGAATVNQAGKVNPAASLLHHVCAYNRIKGVIAAFNQHVGAQGRYELKGGVFIKQHDGVNIRQGRQQQRTAAFILDRPRGPLEAAHRGIAVQAHNQAVALGGALADK